MPFSETQRRCMQGVGLVPWVERSSECIVAVETELETQDASVVVSAETSAPITPPIPEPLSKTSSATVAITDEIEQLLHSPLVRMPFRGDTTSVLGHPDSPLLVLVEATNMQQSAYPFEPQDARLFDDMLRAIHWRRQTICLAVIPPLNQLSVATESSDTVNTLLKNHRDAVLVFKSNVPDFMQADDHLLDIRRPGTLAWQLPHPEVLRANPAKKRQAWNVLKAARNHLAV